MINEHDIKDMQPDKKFDQGIPLAANHAGWLVTHWIYGEGYLKLEGPFETRGNAEAVMKLWQKRFPNDEFFITEALKAK